LISDNQLCFDVVLCYEFYFSKVNSRSTILQTTDQNFGSVLGTTRKKIVTYLLPISPPSPTHTPQKEFNKIINTTKLQLQLFNCRIIWYIPTKTAVFLNDFIYWVYKLFSPAEITGIYLYQWKVVLEMTWKSSTDIWVATVKSRLFNVFTEISVEIIYSL